MHFPAVHNNHQPPSPSSILLFYLLSSQCFNEPHHSHSPPILRSHSTRLLAATTLRNVLGTKNLAEILSERETISQVMQNSLDEATDPWGVKVGVTLPMSTAIINSVLFSLSQAERVEM